MACHRRAAPARSSSLPYSRILFVVFGTCCAINRAELKNDEASIPFGPGAWESIMRADRGGINQTLIRVCRTADADDTVMAHRTFGSGISVLLTSFHIGILHSQFVSGNGLSELRWLLEVRMCRCMSRTSLPTSGPTKVDCFLAVGSSAKSDKHEISQILTLLVPCGVYSDRRHICRGAHLRMYVAQLHHYRNSSANPLQTFKPRTSPKRCFPTTNRLTCTRSTPSCVSLSLVSMLHRRDQEPTTSQTYIFPQLVHPRSSV